jgi:hypothetical protein
VLPAVAAPAGAHAVVAVYPPWWNAGRALKAAETIGPALPGAARFAVLVQGLGPTGPARLRRSGALLILSADVPWCSAETQGS